MNNLRFAGDVVLVSSSINDLQDMVEELCKKSEGVGLTINYFETKVMSNSNVKPRFSIGGNEIEITSEHKYLGQTLAVGNRLEKELRIANARKTFWGQKIILKSKMHLSHKIKVFESCVIPSLTTRYKPGC